MPLSTAFESERTGNHWNGRRSVPTLTFQNKISSFFYQWRSRRKRSAGPQRLSAPGQLFLNLAGQPFDGPQNLAVTLEEELFGDLRAISGADHLGPDLSFDIVTLLLDEWLT